ncbi:MAG: hypothetical protein ABR525_03045 [Candidatus Limnocylindria bacterium]
MRLDRSVPAVRARGVHRGGSGGFDDGRVGETRIARRTAPMARERRIGIHGRGCFDGSFSGAFVARTGEQTRLSGAQPEDGRRGDREREYRDDQRLPLFVIGVG